jgi:hypothetical protein
MDDGDGDDVRCLLLLSALLPPRLLCTIPTSLKRSSIEVTTHSSRKERVDELRGMWEHTLEGNGNKWRETWRVAPYDVFP